MRKSAAEFGDWNDLRFFLAVARTGRLTAAAKTLSVNHSTVERRISALERAMGARLFDRRPDGYTLSPKGAELIPIAEEIEARWLDATAKVSGADASLRGTVRIGAPDGLGTFFLAPRLARLGETMPGLRFELVAMPLVLNPTKREADIAVGFARPARGHLTTRKMTDYSLRLYASRDYVERHGEPRTREDLHRVPLIGYIPGMVFVRELDYLSEIVDGLSPAYSSTNIVAQFKMTAAGNGVCVLPDYMAADEPRLVRILPKVRLVRTYYLSYASNLSQVARIRAVLDAIGGWVAKDRALLLP